MENDRSFDPETALAAHFAAERAEEARTARPLAEPRAIRRKPSRPFAEACALAGLAACLAIGVSLPFRSPLIDRSARAFAACSRNGTFRELGEGVLAMSMKAGERLCVSRQEPTTEEP